MNLRKIFFSVAIILAAATSFAKTKIVTTIFPEYDWVMEIAEDKAKDSEVTLLIGKGVDLHSYQPSIKDIAKISTADIFIYVGGESDEWVEDALANAKNKDMKVINLMEVLGDKVKAEEVIEGMQAEEEHEHHEGEEEEETEYDEHVWLSVRNAKILCNEIANALCEKDSKNASTYKSNLASYTAKLDSLDTDFEKTVKNGSTDTLLFADRFPFRYFVDDYNLKYYAAFVGCSAETEASFETIAFLAGKVDELNLKNVCQIESGNGKIARTVIQSSKNKKAKILTFDSMQSVTTKDIKKGTTYLGIMNKNLEVLKEALK